MTFDNLFQEAVYLVDAIDDTGVVGVFWRRAVSVGAEGVDGHVARGELDQCQRRGLDEDDDVAVFSQSPPCVAVYPICLAIPALSTNSPFPGLVLEFELQQQYQH